MSVSAKAWRRSRATYRVLVAVQTIAWAVTALTKVIARQPRAAPDEPIGIGLAIAALSGLAAGLLTYYARTAGRRDRRTVILTWVWFQAGGVSALVGYAITGKTICFVAGIMTLMLMHAFSPNRFRDDREPE